MFKREEQNFVAQNEIDNMALIMPSQDKHASMASAQHSVEPKGDDGGKPSKKKRGVKVNYSYIQAMFTACFNYGFALETDKYSQLKLYHVFLLYL